jgi:hypothetical protein
MILVPLRLICALGSVGFFEMVMFLRWPQALAPEPNSTAVRHYPGVPFEQVGRRRPLRPRCRYFAIGWASLSRAPLSSHPAPELPF